MKIFGSDPAFAHRAWRIETLTDPEEMFPALDAVLRGLDPRILSHLVYSVAGGDDYVYASDETPREMCQRLIEQALR